MTSAPRLGLLLDVDGPIASPITRTIAIDSIAADLVAIANAGNPVVFNTGRSDAFIRDVVLGTMREHGLAADAPVWAICEKGATWFALPAAGDLPEVRVDDELLVPAAFVEAAHGIADDFAQAVFWDATKRTMVSIEQRLELSAEDFAAMHPALDAALEAELTRQGLDAAFRLDSTIISSDVEHRSVGKDLGARRALELVRERGVEPRRWYTAGDSRSDYAMADELHRMGLPVEHLDVRPADGVPTTAYPVLVADDPTHIHDDATAPYLTRWRVEAGA